MSYFHMSYFLKGMCQHSIIKDMNKIKYTLLALVSSSAISQAATIVGTGSLAHGSTIGTQSSHTFSGLEVTDGSTTITYDLTLTGDFRIFVDDMTINLNDKTASFAVSNVSDDHATETFTFDGFTSIHAFHNLNVGTGTFNLTHAGGTSSVTPPLGSDGDNGTTDKTGITPTFAASPTFSVALTSLETSSNFVRFDEVGVSFSSSAVPEPSSAALLGLGGLALILRRRK